MSRKIFAVVCAMMLAGCANQPHQPVADPDYSDDVKNEVVNHKMARIAVILGNATVLGMPVKNANPANLFINDIPVGVVGKGECMAIDVKPGIYKLFVKETNSTATYGKLYKVTAGKTVYLALDRITNNGPTLAMAILTLGHVVYTQWNVALVDHSADGQQIISDMKIVLPNDGASSQIHPLKKKINYSYQ